MLCLVLDLDGTLFGEDYDDYRLRPYLKEFFDWSFRECRQVALWTAASKEHLDNCVMILKKYVPQGRDFAFTWHDDKITRRIPISLLSNIGEARLYHFKDMKKIWKAKSRQEMGYTKHTTLLIDNTPHVFMNSRSNGLVIPTYHGHEENDDHLLQTIEKLKAIKIKIETLGSLR